MNNWDDIFKKLKEWDFEFDFIEEILKMDDAEKVLHNRLEKALDDFDNGNYEESDIILDFALLLGELKSQRSLPLFLRILSYDDDDIYKILGDMLFEAFPFVIYSVGENKLDEIADFLRKDEISVWNRASALVSLEWMVKTNPEKKEEIIQILREAFEVEELHSFLIPDIFAHNLFELEELAREAYAFGEFDPKEFTENDLQFNNYEKHLKWDTLEKAYNHLFNIATVNAEYMDSVKEETLVRGFGMYEGIEDEGFPSNVFSNDFFERPQPRISSKIGRNEPCPCGSGKKYKKCCGK